MTERKLTVELTVSQWNALHACAVGELEAMTEFDRPHGKDLRAAVRAMERDRRKEAK